MPRFVSRRGGSLAPCCSARQMRWPLAARPCVPRISSCGPPPQTTPPADHELSARQAIRDCRALREAQGRARQAPAPPAGGVHERARGRWQVSYYDGDDEIAQAIVDERSRRRGRGLDRTAGRLADGAWPAGRLRPQGQRSLHLDPADGRLRRAVLRLAAAVAPAPPRPAGPARRSRSRTLYFNRGEIFTSVPLVYPGARLSAGADAAVRVRAAASGSRSRRSGCSFRSPTWRWR